MAKYDIFPGDKVEIKFIGHVTEVQINDQDDYVLTVKIDKGPKRFDSIMLNMKTIDSNCFRKLKYDEFLGDYI